MHSNKLHILYTHIFSKDFRDTENLLAFKKSLHSTVLVFTYNSQEHSSSFLQDFVNLNVTQSLIG